MSNWRYERLGDVSKTGSGGTPLKGRKEYFEGGTIPWLMSGEVAQGNVTEAKNFITEAGLKDSAARLFPSNTVLIAMYGATAGQVGILRFEATTNQAICGILPNDRFIPEFLYYFFLGQKDALVAQAVGNAQPNISQIKIKDTLVPVPPLEEQRQIVAVLDEAFAAIATATANAERNLANARELFESEIDRQVGWQAFSTLALDDLADDITDGDHQPPPKASSGVPFITISNIHKDLHEIDFSDTFLVSKEYYDGLSRKRQPRRGDILYTVTGSFGIPVVVEEDREFCFQRHVGLIRPKRNVDGRWLYYVLRSKTAQRQADAAATGTAQRTVGLRALRTFDIPSIPHDEQKRIGRRLNGVRSEVELLSRCYANKVEMLGELKQSILNRAFSGELTEREPLAA